MIVGAKITRANGCKEQSLHEAWCFRCIFQMQLQLYPLLHAEHSTFQVLKE